MGQGDETVKLSDETVRAILERFQDQHVMDYASGYGEPGYAIDGWCDDGEETPYVVLGDYWCRCDKFGQDQPGRNKLHNIAAHWPKLFERLEAQGVEFEWYDEWMVDYESDKAYRTQPDSYSWQPSVIVTESCEWLTPSDDLTTWVEWAAESSTHAIPATIARGVDLEALGFTCWESGLENGWYPGQDADPAKVKDAIRESEGDDTEVVFSLDHTGQFDVEFSAWYRKPTDDSDSDD